MPYKNLSDLDTNATSVDSGSTFHREDTGGQDNRAELRNELLRYGVDPKMLDDTALELYAAFRIPPESSEKTDPLAASTQPEDSTGSSGLERFLALPKTVLSTVNGLRIRIRPLVRKNGLRFLAISSGIVLLCKQIGGTHFHVDALIKGMTVL